MNTYIIKLSRWKIFCLALLAILLLLVVFTLATNEENPLANPNVNYKGAWEVVETFISSVIVAPILETLIFQMFVFWGVGKLVSKRRNFFASYISLSSLLFGLSHYFSPAYIFYASCIGVILAYTYFIFKERGENAFLMVSLLHATFNFLLFCLGMIAFS